MNSSHANVCNVTRTREEVVMLFRMNQAWKRTARSSRRVVSDFMNQKME